VQRHKNKKEVKQKWDIDEKPFLVNTPAEALLAICHHGNVQDVRFGAEAEDGEVTHEFAPVFLHSPDGGGLTQNMHISPQRFRLLCKMRSYRWKIAKTLYLKRKLA
jgi:hypothetical protein